ncbi:MAG: hypothetical protein M0Z66_07205 [Thermaerobacter sp.]|nr:hypothetical protein [Thermaerobacter sp.]
MRIRRIGCAGDYAMAARLLSRLDGTVGAIGLGGLNFAYRLRGRSWPMPGAERLRSMVRRTPFVDGSCFKDVIEPQAASALPGHGQALVVSLLDRPAAGSALAAVGYRVQVGDAHFALGVPVWPSQSTFAVLAGAAMPLLRHLPREAVYGPRQDRTRTMDAHWEVIWGDVQLLRRRPIGLRGATIVCGSLRTDDARWLRERGVRELIAPSPPVNGEVLGANLWEAVLAALYGRALGQDEIGAAWRAVQGSGGWFTIV